MGNRINQLTKELSAITAQISDHPVYTCINSISHLQLFMEQHVFAVWDFMCLLKELHRGLVSTSAPWLPPLDAFSANLIASILVEEEGDINQDGTYESHFDIYIAAMKQVGADTTCIEQLLLELRHGKSVDSILAKLPISNGTKRFVLTTFSFFDRPVHELAAAFVYGREGITANMFMPLLEELQSKIFVNKQSKLDMIIYYLKRHIDLDGNEHFPKALKLLSNLVGDSEQKMMEAKNAALKALNARLDFLSDIQSILLEGESHRNITVETLSLSQHQIPASH